MRPQIGKRAKKESSAEKEKSLAREFVEGNLKKNLAIRDEYLTFDEVKTAININTIEQRIYMRNKILSWLRSGDTIATVMARIEEENHFDRHRLNKML